MPKLPLAAALLLTCLSSAAAAQSAQAPAPAACGAPALADRVSLDPVAGSSLMTVPVAIEGKTKRFLLDVGGNPDEVSQATVGELNLTVIDMRTAANTIAEINPYLQFQPPMVDVRGTIRTTPQPRVRVGDFTLGSVTLHGMQLLVSADSELGKSKPYDGLLTAAGFRRYDMDLDFGGRQLSFLAATGCSDPGQIVTWPHSVVAVIPMTLNDGKPSIPVTIAGHQIDAVIDTGADHTIMRRAVAERLFGLKADTPDMMQDGDLRDGGGMRVYRHTFPQIAFEGVTASNVPARIQSNSMVRSARRAAVTGSRLAAPEDVGTPVPDLTLGMDVLSQLHLYVAFGQNKIYATPAAASAQ